MPDRTLGGAPPHAPQVIGGAVEVVNNLTDSALAAPPADQPAAGRLYNGNKKKTKKMDKLKAKAKGNPGPGQTSEVFKEGLDNGFSAAVETVANPALTSQAAPILHKGLTGAGTKKVRTGPSPQGVKCLVLTSCVSTVCRRSRENDSNQA